MPSEYKNIHRRLLQLQNFLLDSFKDPDVNIRGKRI